MAYFTTTRNTELSVIYYLDTQIQANWSGITTVKSFASAYDQTLPVICIRLLGTDSDRLEVGSTTLTNIYRIGIDVFATSDGQRIDLADFIVDQLKSGCVYYSHSHPVGDNSSLTRTPAGRITVTSFDENSRLDFGDEASNPDRFRSFIQVSVRVGLS